MESPDLSYKQWLATKTAEPDEVPATNKYINSSIEQKVGLIWFYKEELALRRKNVQIVANNIFFICKQANQQLQEIIDWKVTSDPKNIQDKLLNLSINDFNLVLDILTGHFEQKILTKLHFYQITNDYKTEC